MPSPWSRDGDAHNGTAADRRSPRLAAELALTVISLCGAAVFDRVVDQVLEDLGQLVAHRRARRADRRGSVELDAHAALGGAQFERVGDLLDNAAPSVDPAGRRDMLVQLDPRQRQQIVDQPRHARGLLAHDAEKALARGGVVARRRPAASR